MLEHIHTFTGHRNPIYTLENFDDDDLFFSAGNDMGVVLWSLKEQAFKKVLFPVKSSVYKLLYYKNQLIHVERGGLLSIYDLEKQKFVHQKVAHKQPVFDVKLNAANNELVTASEDGSIAVWNLEDLSEKTRIRVSQNTVRCMAFSPDGTELALGAKDKQVYIYRTSDYSLKHILTGHRFGVTSLAYHPQGKYLLSGSRDAQIKVWALPDYQETQNIAAHLYGVYALSFHPKLALFASASQDKSIKIWDAEAFSLYKILSVEKMQVGHTHSINSLFWTKDGKHLLSAGDDRKIIAWGMD